MLALHVEFIGRLPALRTLGQLVTDVVSSGSGKLLTVRGRRQVGKSRLLTHFTENSGLAYLYFSAVRNAPTGQQLSALTADAATATRPLADLAALFASPPGSWAEAFSKIADSCRVAPSIVVLDEFPWAVEADPTLEGTLQNAWDRQFERVPVLLVLVGSDVAMMERLTHHDRPLFGRSRTMVVNPFDPGECASALGGERDPMDAFDTYLITGGYPRLVASSARARHVLEFAEEQLADETSELIVTAQFSLDAEFPPDAQARRVLSAIGWAEVGAPAFSQVVGSLGESGATETAVTRALKVLVDTKRVVGVDHPVGTELSTRLRRYRIRDSYLRFWFRFVEPQLANIARGRADLAAAGLRRGWPSWRGKAIEPTVHEGLLRMAPDLENLAGVVQVGGWWNRNNNPEVDIIAARDAMGRSIAAVGTVKWRENTPITRNDVAALYNTRTVVPGAADALLLGVCPAGAHPDAGLDLELSARQLMTAWAPR
jgi:AAA+ ATPase superfamily predicted ATPase